MPFLGFPYPFRQCGRVSSPWGPITHSSADYLKPLKNGDDVNIEIIVTQLKQSSFELSYSCKNQKGDMCAEVKTVHVFINKQTWKKKKMDVEIEEGLRQHLSEK